ncbi:two pore potassium channel protein sup-9-like [Hydractinia symbiolongicarpus]|uniref:two pore potassium channel protein sup-9-like n=1 Tax=Hydractinia symbiolongicarpus TaxID=13093 RepID=UPI002551C319|nr:two pore potassium channel protein sup-9-like [Hydractinia symbiolongicarpus]
MAFVINGNEILSKYKDDCKRFLKGSLGLILLGEAYICAGALLFIYLEECLNDGKAVKYTKQEELCFEAKEKYNDTSLLTNNQSFIRKLLVFCNDTVERENPKCDFSNKYLSKWWLYTFTVCSTIGYGNTVPVTDLGKFVTMLYAIPGIAITITGYTFLGRLLTNLTRICIIRFEQRILKHKKVALLNVKTLIFLTYVAICNLLVFAWMSSLKETENFRYFDAIYFGFITQTTIGFGDFYYHFEMYFDKPHLLFPSTFFFIIGLGLIAAVIASISDASFSEK